MAFIFKSGGMSLTGKTTDQAQKVRLRGEGLNDRF